MHDNAIEILVFNYFTLDPSNFGLIQIEKSPTTPQIRVSSKGDLAFNKTSQWCPKVSSLSSDSIMTQPPPPQYVILY